MCTGSANVFELILSMFRLIPQTQAAGISSHIATVAYFCDQSNSIAPLKSGRRVALLVTKL